MDSSFISIADTLDINCFINNSSSISIALNKAPKGGYCEYKYANNVHELGCYGWNDVELDYPLFYSFVLNDNINLCDLQISNVLSNVFLPFDAQNVSAYIYDSQYAFTIYTFQVHPQQNQSQQVFDKELSANKWIASFLSDIDDLRYNVSVQYWFTALIGISDTYHWNLYMNNGSPLRYLQVLSYLIKISQMRALNVSHNLLSRFYNAVLDENINNITKTWYIYASIATNNRQFQFFYDNIIDVVCSKEYHNIDATLVLECIYILSNITSNIHVNSYNIQNNEIVFDQQTNSIHWKSQRNVLNLNDISSFGCSYDNIYWPTSVTSFQSLIQYRINNQTALFQNIDCFFMEMKQDLLSILLNIKPEYILSKLLRIELYSFSIANTIGLPWIHNAINTNMTVDNLCSDDTNLLLIEFKIDFDYELVDIYLDTLNKTILTADILNDYDFNIPQCQSILLTDNNLENDQKLCRTLHDTDEGLIYCQCNVSQFTDSLNHYGFYIENVKLNPLIQLLHDFNLQKFVNILLGLYINYNDTQIVNNDYHTQDIDLWDINVLTTHRYYIIVMVVSIIIFSLFIVFIFCKYSSDNDRPLLLFVDEPSSKLKDIKRLEMKILLNTALYHEGVIINRKDEIFGSKEYHECYFTVCLSKWYELFILKLRSDAWISCWFWRYDGSHLFCGHRIVLVLLYVLTVFVVLCFEYEYNKYLIPTNIMTSIGGECGNFIFVCCLVSVLSYIPIICLQYLFIHSAYCIERPPIVELKDIDPLKLNENIVIMDNNKNNKSLFDPNLYQQAYLGNKNKNTNDANEEEIHYGSSVASPVAAPAFYHENRHHYKSAAGRNYAASKSQNYAAFTQYNNKPISAAVDMNVDRNIKKKKQLYPNYYNDAYAFGYPDPYNYSMNSPPNYQQNALSQQPQPQQPRPALKYKKSKKSKRKKHHTRKQRHDAAEEEKEGLKIGIAAKSSTERYNLWDLYITARDEMAIFGDYKTKNKNECIPEKVLKHLLSVLRTKCHYKKIKMRQICDDDPGLTCLGKRKFKQLKKYLKEIQFNEREMILNEAKLNSVNTDNTELTATYDNNRESLSLPKRARPYPQLNAPRPMMLDQNETSLNSKSRKSWSRNKKKRRKYDKIDDNEPEEEKEGGSQHIMDSDAVKMKKRKKRKSKKKGKRTDVIMNPFQTIDPLTLVDEKQVHEEHAYILPPTKPPPIGMKPVLNRKKRQQRPLPPTPKNSADIMIKKKVSRGYGAGTGRTRSKSRSVSEDIEFDELYLKYNPKSEYFINVYASFIPWVLTLILYVLCLMVFGMVYLKVFYDDNVLLNVSLLKISNVARSDYSLLERITNGTNKFNSQQNIEIDVDLNISVDDIYYVISKQFMDTTAADCDLNYQQQIQNELYLLIQNKNEMNEIIAPNEEFMQFYNEYLMDNNGTTYYNDDIDNDFFANEDNINSFIALIIIWIVCVLSFLLLAQPVLLALYSLLLIIFYNDICVKLNLYCYPVICWNICCSIKHKMRYQYYEYLIRVYRQQQQQQKEKAIKNKDSDAKKKKKRKKKKKKKRKNNKKINNIEMQHIKHNYSHKSYM